MANKDVTIDLKAPKSLKDLRFKHLPAYIDVNFLEKGNEPDDKTLISFCSKLLNHSEALIRTCKRSDLLDIYLHCINIFGGYKLLNPPKQIEIKGVIYELVDTSRPSVGFCMDVDQSDFEKDPVRLAAMCYIPKGTKYGALDENENLIHPIASRYKDFEEHFPLIHYFELNAFFLSKWKQSAKIYTVKKKTTEAIRKALKRLGLQSMNG